MMVTDLISLSTRMFRTRPMRTWLTILGIGVGISAVLFLVALGYGLQRVILQKIIFNQALMSINVTSQTDAIVIDAAIVDETRTFAETDDVATLSRFPSQAAAGVLNANLDILVIDPAYFSYAGIVASRGKLIDPKENGTIVVSSAVMKLLDIPDEYAIGTSIELETFVADDGDPERTHTVALPDRYRVVGIIDDVQSPYAYFPRSEFEARIPLTRFDEMRVHMRSQEDIPTMRDRFFARGFQVTSLSETVDQANKIFSVIQIVLALFGAVSLVVSSIGMFNTMTVTLMERTNEIGIMRSLGATRRDIMALFLTEAFVIGFLGGCVGIGIGYVAGTLVNFGINTLAVRLGGAKVELFVFPQAFIFFIIGISAAIGFIAGIFPSRRAARMNPLEALRYK